MGEEKKRDYPFKITEYYSPGLNSLKRIYTQHPDFNGNVRLIYELLFDHWNPDYGYAFPTIWQLSEESGLGEATVKRCIKTLVSLELIEKKPSSVAKNNIYFLKKPVKTIDELIVKFPVVENYREKRLARIKASEEASKARFSKKKSDDGKVEKQEVSITENIATETESSKEECDLDTWL